MFLSTFSWLFVTLLASVCHADHHQQSPQQQQALPNATEIIKAYYANYRRMDDQRLQSELFIMWFSTGGGGDFDLKEQISDECKRVSTAAADVWQDLPTVEVAAPLIDDGIRAAISDIRTTNDAIFVHPMEKVCKHLELSIQLNPTVNTKFLRFQRLPKSTAPEFAKNRKQIVDGTSSTNYVNRFYATLLGVPKVGQLIAHGMFVSHYKSFNCAVADFRLARAIIELSKQEELRTSVQYAYEKGLYDVIQFVLEILDRDKNGDTVAAFQIVNNAIMARIRENFEKDPKLRNELANMEKMVSTNICKSAQ